MTITQNLTRASEYNRAIALIVWSEQHSISVSGGVDGHVANGGSKEQSCPELSWDWPPANPSVGKTGQACCRLNTVVIKHGPLTDSHSHGNLLLRILFIIDTLMFFGVAIWRSLPVIWRWL